MLLNARHINDASQPDPLILMAMEDITERKRAEENTLRAAEKLASAGRIAATIAHEINNPLDILSSVMYLMGQNAKLDPATRDLVERGEETVHRITSITRQTLGLFSSSTQVQLVSLSKVLDETLELLGRKLHEQSISVIRRYDDEGKIQAAPTELRQIFTNLIVNAIAAMPAGGKLTLHVYAATDWRRPKRRGIRVVIADTGEGIPYEHQTKIFEPFFTTKGEKGTGLGLYVISSIVRKYEGTIRLRSPTVNGRCGTCFLTFFPVNDGSNSAPEAKAPRK
jgi:signal transduction histidine kinase